MNVPGGPISQRGADEQRCRTCKFYDQLDSDYKDKAKVGYCRRHAPQPLIDAKDDDALFYAHWPLVQFSDSCGEWQFDGIAAEPRV